MGRWDKTCIFHHSPRYLQVPSPLCHIISTSPSLVHISLHVSSSHGLWCLNTSQPLIFYPRMNLIPPLFWMLFPKSKRICFVLTITHLEKFLAHLHPSQSHYCCNHFEAPILHQIHYPSPPLHSSLHHNHFELSFMPFCQRRSIKNHHQRANQRRQLKQGKIGVNSFCLG